MEDKKSIVSYDVKYEIRTESDGTYLDVIADKNWINDPNRLFPIIIDPTVMYFETENQTAVGTMISSYYPSGKGPQGSYYTYQHNYIGQSVNHGTTRSLYKFNLAQIPTGAYIKDATLHVANTTIYATTQKPTVNVHPLTSSWNYQTVGWSNQPSLGGVKGTYVAQNLNPAEWKINITDLAKDWYNGFLPNYGLELKYADESQACREIVGTYVKSDPNHPYISIQYEIDGFGNQPYWTFNGPVNMANMNLVLPFTDISFSGRQIPLTLERTYNSRKKDAGPFGYGWSSPINMRLYGYAGSPVRLVGSTGTQYYFNPDSTGKYLSPTGVNWTLSLNSSTGTITMLDKTVYTFTKVPNTNNEYALSSVRDIDGNTLSNSYTGSYVTGITDNAGHTITITYENGFVKTAKDPAGRLWTYGYDGTANLVSVTSPDGKILRYRYDGNHNLIAAQSPDGRIIYYDYNKDSVYPYSRLAAINPTNMVTNSSLEVSNDPNKPDHFNYDQGSYTYKLVEDSSVPFGKRAFEIDSSSSIAPNYTVFLSDPISVNRGINYTLSGSIKAVQNSGTTTTVLSLYAYDASGNYLGEFGKISNTGTFGWIRKSSTINANTLPSNTSYVKVKLGANSFGGSGSSWWDGIQLEESLTPTPFVSGLVYTYWPPNKQSAVYDGDGVKTLYSYNDYQNFTSIQLDPNQLNLKDEYNWVSNRVSTYKDSAGNTWTYTRDPATGSITQSKNPLGGTESYSYNSNSNLTQFIDLDGGVYKYTYDNSYNNITSRDANNTSLATIYDKYGNVVNETDPIAIMNNLVSNSGFEYGIQSDGKTPSHFAFSVGKQGTWYVSSQTKVSGSNSLVISAQDSTSNPNYSVLLSDPIKIYTDTVGYMIAGNLKAASTSGTQVTVLSAYVYDINGNYLNELGRLELDGAADWDRFRTIIPSSELPYGSDQVRIKVAAKNIGGSGISYFDNIQFQQNLIDSPYNMVGNSNFELGGSNPNWSNGPNDWNPADSGTSNWVSASSSPVYTGNRAMSISNATIDTGIRYQNYLKYDSSKDYTFEAFAKSVNLSAKVGKIKIAEYDANYNQIGFVVSSALEGNTDWARLAAVLPKGSAVSGTVYIRPILMTGNATGTIYFDNVHFLDSLVGSATYSYSNGVDNSNTWVYKETDPLGNSMNYERDAEGNITAAIDPLGNKTKTQYYTNSNWVMSDTLPGNDLMISYTYDNDGNIKTITYQDVNKTTVGSTTKIDYGKSGAPTLYTDGLNRQTSITYTPAGNLESIKSPTGVVSYDYDSAGRTSIIFYGNSQRYKFTYDNNGNVKTITDYQTNTTINANYDALDRLISYNDGKGAITYSYNPSGAITGRQLKWGPTSNPLSLSQSSSFNISDILREIKDVNGLRNFFLFNEDGSLSMQQLGNGAIETIEYDLNGRITKFTNKTKNGLVLSSYKFTYDKNNQVLSITDKNSVSLRYTYSPKGQLATEKLANGNTITYSYVYNATTNPFANLSKRVETKPDGTIVSSTTYTYDKANQLVNVNGTAYSYNNAGQVTSNGKYKFKWDEGGRLTEIDTLSGSILATYKYDDQNRRIEQKVNGVVTKYLYDGFSNHVLAEFDGSGNLTKYYTWGPTGLLAITTYQIGTSNPIGKYYVVKNAHGDIIALQDQNGTNVATYSYDTWGNILTSTDTNNINPYRYAGYRFDNVTGLYYLIARYYDPKVGRFLSTDPEKITPSYSYVDYNPVSYFDPNGRNPLVIVGAVIYLAIGEEVGVGLLTAAFVAGMNLLLSPFAANTSDSKGGTAPSSSNPSTPSTTGNEGSVSKPGTVSKDPYARPSGYRKGVREKVFERAREESVDGLVRDPETGVEINYEDPWDMGHEPGFEHRKHKESARKRGIPRKKYLDEHNNPEIYRPETPSTNRGRRLEAPDSINYWP